jgi:hypothetical protein
MGSFDPITAVLAFALIETKLQFAADTRPFIAREALLDGGLLLF